VKRIRYALLSIVLAAPAAAQSLKGSHASVEKMYTRAVLNDLQFYSTSKGVYESVRDGELKLISITMDLTLDKVSYPFALPRTVALLNAFAKKYHETCGERLVVTSAARPRTEQPRNASPQSVHPTGMAVDFRKPSGACLTFMRGELLALEKMGMIEATEERHPVHFHVAVLRGGSLVPTATVASATQTPTPAQPSAVVATATDSAGGTVDLAKPDSKPEAKPSTATRASTYVVKKGDNLSAIAKRFGLTVSRLKSLNGLRTSNLKPGQKLKTG
jgi:LysM repeat protein